MKTIRPKNKKSEVCLRWSVDDNYWIVCGAVWTTSHGKCQNKTLYVPILDPLILTQKYKIDELIDCLKQLKKIKPPELLT